MAAAGVGAALVWLLVRRAMSTRGIRARTQGLKRKPRPRPSHDDRCLALCRGIENARRPRGPERARPGRARGGSRLAAGRQRVGKTTLLRIIAGLVAPDRGLISLDGRVVWSPDVAVPPERRRIGMVFQDYALWPHMSVARNLDFGLKAQKLPELEVRRRVDHALEVTRLAQYRDRYPSELSGGQQQRVAIARCLAARPALMLFDEPLSNLDAALREDMRVEMMDLVRREGITVVYVTHDQAEAMAVSDRVAVMRSGTIAQCDTPQKIYGAPTDSFVASFIGGFSLVHGKARGRMFEIADGGAPLKTATELVGEAVLVVRPEDARPPGATSATSCGEPSRRGRSRVDAGDSTSTSGQTA